MTGLIGVTGASGQVGRRVVARLAAAGAPQRLIVRDPSRAPRPSGVDTQVAVATFADRPALQAAFTDVETLLLVSAAEDADRMALHANAVKAAVSQRRPRRVPVVPRRGSGVDVHLRP